MTYTAEKIVEIVNEAMEAVKIYFDECNQGISEATQNCQKCRSAYFEEVKAKKTNLSNQEKTYQKELDAELEKQSKLKRQLTELACNGDTESLVQHEAELENSESRVKHIKAKLLLVQGVEPNGNKELYKAAQEADQAHSALVNSRNKAAGKIMDVLKPASKLHEDLGYRYILSGHMFNGLTGFTEVEKHYQAHRPDR